MRTTAPFADAAGPAGVRADRLLDVEAGQTSPDRTLLAHGGRVDAVAGPQDGLDTRPI